MTHIIESISSFELAMGFGVVTTVLGIIGVVLIAIAAFGNREDERLMRIGVVIYLIALAMIFPAFMLMFYSIHNNYH